MLLWEPANSFAGATLCWMSEDENERSWMFWLLQKLTTAYVIYLRKKKKSTQGKKVQICLSCSVSWHPKAKSMSNTEITLRLNNWGTICKDGNFPCHLRRKVFQVLFQFGKSYIIPTISYFSNYLQASHQNSLGLILLRQFSVVWPSKASLDDLVILEWCSN